MTNKPEVIRTALLIVNPNSRQAGETDLNETIQSLENAGIHIVKVDSQSQEETQKAIETHCEKLDFVIVAGGDGTICSTAALLYKFELPLAILPLGTANDLARSLGIPDNLEQACQIIIENFRSKIDLASVNGHYFLNAANIGMGVFVSRELKKDNKKFWGKFSYVRALFSAIYRSHRFKLIVKVNDEVHRMSSTQVAIGNGRFYGGGNIIEESATIDDGLLQLYSLSSKTFWQLLSLAPLLRFGKQRRATSTFCISGKHIEVETLPEMKINADGEPVSKTPAIFEVIPAALEVILPKSNCPVGSNSDTIKT